MRLAWLKAHGVEQCPIRAIEILDSNVALLDQEPGVPPTDAATKRTVVRKVDVGRIVTHGIGTANHRLGCVW